MMNDEEKEENFNVFVRVRPMLQRETGSRKNDIVNIS